MALSNQVDSGAFMLVCSLPPVALLLQVSISLYMNVMLIQICFLLYRQSLLIKTFFFSFLAATFFCSYELTKNVLKPHVSSPMFPFVHMFAATIGEVVSVKYYLRKCFLFRGH